MAATHRSDNALLAGYHHSGDRGLGVLGSQVPATGSHGAGLLYAGLALPAEAGDEFMVRISNAPSGLTLVVDEDSAFVATGPDGVYVGLYEGIKNGVSYGSNTFTITIGPGLSGAVQVDSALPSGLFGNTGGSDLSGVLELEPSLASGAAGIAGQASLSGVVALDSSVASGAFGNTGGSFLIGGITLDPTLASGSIVIGAMASLSGATVLGDGMPSGRLVGLRVRGKLSQARIDRSIVRGGW
jgi:hypothetical protein